MSIDHRLRSLIRRGVLKVARAVANALPVAQFTADGEDSFDDVEWFEPNGLATAPTADKHVLVANVGSDADHAVVLGVGAGSDRPTDLGTGGTALYDEHGHQIRLELAGIKLGSAAASLGVARATDPISVTIPIGTVVVGVTGGGGSPAVAVMNSVAITLTGTITTGSTTVKADS